MEEKKCLQNLFNTPAATKKHNTHTQTHPFQAGQLVPISCQDAMADIRTDLKKFTSSKVPIFTLTKLHVQKCKHLHKIKQLGNLRHYISLFDVQRCSSINVLLCFVHTEYQVVCAYNYFVYTKFLVGKFRSNNLATGTTMFDSF